MSTTKQKLVEEFFATLGKMRQIGDSLSNVSPEDKVATMLQMHALSYLKKHPKSTVGEFAKRLYMSSSSIAQFTDRLAVAGFIKKHADDTDRRIVRLTISTKGEKELLAMHKKMHEKMGKLLQLVSENDLIELVRIHKKILKSSAFHQHDRLAEFFAGSL